MPCPCDSCFLYLAGLRFMLIIKFNFLKYSFFFFGLEARDNLPLHFYFFIFRLIYESRKQEGFYELGFLSSFALNQIQVLWQNFFFTISSRLKLGWKRSTLLIPFLIYSNYNNFFFQKKFHINHSPLFFFCQVNFSITNLPFKLYPSKDMFHW